MTLEDALKQSALFWDRAAAKALAETARKLIDEGADEAFLAKVLEYQRASWEEHREDHLEQTREDIEAVEEAFERGDLPVRHCPSWWSFEFYAKAFCA